MITSKPSRCLKCQRDLMPCELCVLRDNHRDAMDELRDQYRSELDALKSDVAKIGGDLNDTRAVLRCFADGEQAFARGESRLPRFPRTGNEAKWDMWLTGYDLSWDAAKLIAAETHMSQAEAEIQRLREQLIRAQTFIVDWTEWTGLGDRYDDERLAALRPREDLK